MSRGLLRPGGIRYSRKILGIAPNNLVAAWPMDEDAGAVSYDISGHGYNGAYTGVTLGQTGIGDGRTSPLFDGISDFNNVYSAGLATAFNGAELTLLIWAKVLNADVWLDGGNNYLINLIVDGSNALNFWHADNAPQLRFYYLAGGTTKSFQTANQTTTDFFSMAMTVSQAADQMKGYLQGSQVGVTQTGLGVWAGSPTSFTICAYTPAINAGLPGYFAHCALWDTPLTPAQISYLSKP